MLYSYLYTTMCRRWCDFTNIGTRLHSITERYIGLPTIVPIAA
jgi:hypothetical protein